MGENCRRIWRSNRRKIIIAAHCNRPAPDPGERPADPARGQVLPQPRTHKTGFVSSAGDLMLVVAAGISKRFVRVPGALFLIQERLLLVALHVPTPPRIAASPAARIRRGITVTQKG